MSNQRYCHHCGKQVIVGARFCSACGVDLSSLAAIPAPVIASQKPQSQFVPFVVKADGDEDDSYLDRIEHLDIRQNALHVEIVKDKPQGETLGSVVTQGISAGTPPVLEGSRPVQFQDKESFLKEFQQEAGTSRNEKQ